MAQCEVKLKERPTLKGEERQHDSVSLRRRGSKLERCGHKRQLSPSPVRHNSRTESTRAKRRKVGQYSSHFPQRVDGAHGLFTQVNEGAVAELSEVSEATCTQYLCR